MKKTLLIMLVAVILSGCYTTLYPPMSMDMQGSEQVPDSTKQVIINNYYETSEYYQIPHYSRYSWLWGDYYWDPFYYDYSYYRWRPHYWYGYYYYYNPYNNYWYYYDHDYTWHGGGGSGPSSGNNDKERIRKPGYTELMNSPTGSAPYISVYNEDQRTERIGKVGLENKTSRTGTVYTPRLESVGKTSVNPKSTYKSSNNGSNNKSYKVSPTNDSSNNSSSNVTYKQKSRSSSSSSSSSSSKSSKSSRTTSTSSKNSRSQSSSSSSKKSK